MTLALLRNLVVSLVVCGLPCLHGCEDDPYDRLDLDAGDGDGDSGDGDAGDGDAGDGDAGDGDSGDGDGSDPDAGADADAG